MTYEVFYKLRHSLVERKLKKVIGDGLVFSSDGKEFPVRYFVLSDDSRVEIPFEAVKYFRFGPDRVLVIKGNIARETGVQVATK